VTLNPDEIRIRRKEILRNNPGYHLVKKGNRAVGYLRHCCICGRPLTAYIINENRYVAICRHYQITTLGVFKLSMCADVRSCDKHIDKEANQ
jgi:hypothetical protein